MLRINEKIKCKKTNNKMVSISFGFTEYKNNMYHSISLPSLRYLIVLRKIRS